MTSNSSDAPYPRWRQRLIRFTDRAIEDPNFGHLASAGQLARSDEVPTDPEDAIAFVADYCDRRGLCHTGAIDFITRSFERDVSNVLTVLAARASPSVAARVGADTRLTDDAARLLMGHRSPAVLASLAGNQNIADELVDRLADSVHRTVRDRARWNREARST